MRLVFLGLSLSSSWGNGHATTYRALLRALAAQGHEILFLEREREWYAANRDLARAEYCRLAFYASPEELRQFAAPIGAADAVIIGSYVPDCLDVIDEVARLCHGRLCFYDIDTPVTLRKLASGDAEYLIPQAVPRFDIYFSFTGGPSLAVLEDFYGARLARPLYCAVDPSLYQPTGAAQRWALGYLGTYSDDRQPALERLLLEPARRMPQARFVVAGPQYSADIAWPENVDRIEHLPPVQHAAFYSSLGWALNITRADMVRAGYSPSVRLFEATACGCPVISDPWAGLETFFAPGRELLTAEDADEVMQALALPAESRAAIGLAGRARTLRDHTAERRARELEEALRQDADDKWIEGRRGEAQATAPRVIASSEATKQSPA